MPQLTTAPATQRVESKPGKFQGEPLYVASFWEQALEGAADADLYDGETLVSYFGVTGEDLLSFPELRGIDVVALWEDSSGFVHHSDLSQAEYELQLAQLGGDGEEAQ